MIGLIVALAAAAAQQYQAHQVAVKQDKTAAQGIKQQSALRQESNSALQQRLLKLQQSNPDDAITQKKTGYLDQLQRARMVANQGLQQNSGYSDAYNSYADTVTNRENTSGTDLADLMSRIDGPTAQRQAEGFDTADLGTQFEDVARKSQGAGFLTKLKVNGIHSNPWLGLLTEAAGSWGSNYAGRNAPGGP